jgi:hypothetical protein
MLDPAEISLGYFGLSTLQQLDGLAQTAILHDVVHGVDGVPRLSPGNRAALVEYGMQRVEELAEQGVDPSRATLERWWNAAAAAVDESQRAAGGDLVRQDGRNPPGPSPS